MVCFCQSIVDYSMYIIGQEELIDMWKNSDYGLMNQMHYCYTTMS